MYKDHTLKKSAYLIVFAALFLTAATAQTVEEVSVDQSSDQVNLVPGETQMHGELEVQFDDASGINLEDIEDSEIPYSINLTDEEMSNDAFSADIQAEVPSNAPSTSEVQDGQFTLLFDEEVDVDIEYFILEESRVGFDQENITDQRDVGDIGEIWGQLDVEQLKNTPITTINYELEGNITEITQSEQGSLDIFRGTPETIVLRSEIPEDQQFGQYTGNLTIQDQSLEEEDEYYEQVLDVQVDVDDTIPPEIEGTIIDDIQATQTQDFLVVASDNLEVDEVRMEVTREDQEGNLTDVGNYTLEEADGLDEYELEFEDTEHLGEYEAFIEAEDTSGNVANETVEFEVTQLDAINITSTDIEFEPFGDGEEERAQILELEKETPVEIELSFFNHDEPTSSMMVAIEDEEESREGEFELDEQNDTVEIEEPGTYSIMVSSNMEETFSGRLVLHPIEQHIEVDDITFEGAVIEPMYPPETDFQIGETEGELTYTETNSTVMDRVKFVGYTDAEKCRGHEQFTTCLTGYDMGEMQQVRDDNRELREERDDWRQYFWILLGTVTVIYIVKKRWDMLPDHLYAYKKVKYD